MKYLLVCMILFYGAAIAQETKLITKDSSNFTEEYYVLTSNEKVLHGTYVKYQHMRMLSAQSISILEAGSYKHGLKDGEWQYFHTRTFASRKNRLWKQGFYVLGKKNGLWKEYYADTVQGNTQYEQGASNGNTNTVDVVIDHDKLSLFQVGSYLNDRRVGDWISFSEKGEIIQRYNVSKSVLLKDEFIPDSSQVSLNRPAIYFGGKRYLRRQLIISLAYHLGVTFERVKDVAIIKVGLHIDEKGNLVQNVVLESNAKPEVDEAVLKSLEGINKTNWIPALEDGVAKRGLITLTYTFTKDKPVGFREKVIRAQVFINP